MTLSELRDSALGSIGIVRRGWPLLLIALLVDSAFLFIFLIALQSYLPESLHESPAIAGWALAAFGITKLVTQFASGLVVDRLGVRRTLIAGTGMLVLADTSMLPLAHLAPILIIGAAALEGFGSSLTWPAVYAAGDARFERTEKGRFTALLTLATGAALVAGLGGGTALHAALSFNMAMMAPIACVAAAFATAFIVAPGRAGDAHVAAPPTPDLSELRLLFRQPQRAAFAALVLGEAAALGALTAVFRAYGRDVLGVSLAEQGLMLIPAAVLGALIVIPGGAIADRLGPRRVLVPGFAVAGICVLLLSRWTNPGFVVVTAGLAGAGFGLAVPAIASTMLSLAGATATRGGVIGWFMTMDGVGHAAGPAVAGVLIALLSASAVLVAAGILFLCVAYLALVSRLDEGWVPHPAAGQAALTPEPITGGRS